MLFINTRPTNRAKKLTEFLQQQQISVLDLPLLELVACEIFPQNEQDLHQLDQYQAVILVSETAVSYLFDFIHKKNINIKPNQPFIAVGQKTADSFRQNFQNAFHALPNLIAPNDFDLAENNEGMLQLPIIKNLQKNDKVLIIKGKDGRDLLKNTLHEKGVSVRTVDFYERIFPKQSIQIFDDFLKNDSTNYPTNYPKNQKIVVLISSLTAWEHWQTLLNQHAISANDFTYLVLQNRIAGRLYHSNIDKVIVVDNLNKDTILANICLI